MVYEHKAFMLEDKTGNQVVNELFRQARKDTAVISDLTNLFK